MSTGSPLDPEDWPDYRRHAHDLLDSLLDHLEHAATGPVWHPVPEQVKERLAQASAAPQDIEEICGELRDLILPYGTGNTHPRFFGWVHGAGTAGGMLAEMTAAALDANCGGRDHGAI